MLEFLLWFVSFVSLFVSLVWLSTFYLSKSGIVYGTDILQYPAVCLCVPAFNEEKTIAKTLNSLLKLDYPKEKLEILVIDDGSTDNTYGAAKAFLEESGAGNIVIIQQKNAGKAAALNTALKKAHGDLFGCVDADSTVSEDSFKKIVPHFNDGRVGAVVSTILVAQEKKFLQKVQRFEYILSSFFRKLFTSMESLYVTTGVLSVYRRQILVDLGGFDEKNITEDLEMGMRLNYYKYKVVVEMGSKTHTEVPFTIKAFWRQRIRWLRGHVYNTLKYRKMLFNKEYGFMGMFQLPLHLLSPVLMILSATIISYGFLDRTYWFLLKLSVAPKSIFVISLPTLRELLLGTKFPIVFPSFILIFLSLFMYDRAHKYLQEKWRFPFAFIVFLTIYPLVISYIWIAAMTEEYFGIKRGWR